MTDAEQELRQTLAIIATAAALVESVKPTILRYLDEAQRFDSIGAIIDPTLFMKPERQRVDAALRPMMALTLKFLASVENAKRDVAAMRERT